MKLIKLLFWAVLSSFFAGGVVLHVVAQPADPGGQARFKHLNESTKLKLVGVKSNRSAIGARIKITVEEPSGQRNICKTVNSGGSFGCSPLRQEIGLGQARSIPNLEIWWPTSGIRQNFTNLEPNQCYTIREGDTNAVVTVLKPFTFAKAAAHAHQEIGPARRSLRGAVRQWRYRAGRA